MCKTLWYARNYSDCVLSCKRCWSTVNLDRRIAPECIMCGYWARGWHCFAAFIELYQLMMMMRHKSIKFKCKPCLETFFSDTNKDLSLLKQSVFLVRQTFCLFPVVGSTSDQLWRETLSGSPTCVEWTAWDLSDRQVNKSPFCWLTFEIAACLAPHSALLLIIYKSQQYGSEVLMRWHPLLWPPSNQQQR